MSQEKPGSTGRGFGSRKATQPSSVTPLSLPFPKTGAIEGPIPNLWLDYSQVTGTLNQMQVAQPGGKANVHLAWECVNENVEIGPCES
jgi:hypothetical protein